MPPTATAPVAADARRRHFARFYGGPDAAASAAPLALVVGNCQAESLRLVLDGAGLATVTMPPVHELEAGDLPHLERWLAHARVLVTQPVRPGYRGLPIGAAELAARLRPGARVVRVPVIRFAGLYPTHAIVRPPGDPGLVPPLAPYHDLRVLAEAATRRAGRGAERLRVTPQAVREVAAASIAELRRRERHHATVIVSDLFARPSFAQMRTLNHPGNVVWEAVGRRVLDALGIEQAPTDPGRPLLAAIHAPRAAAVIAAFGLDEAAEDDWRIEGERVPQERVRAAHLAFYARHPEVVAAGLARHAATLARLVRP